MINRISLKYKVEPEDPMFALLQALVELNRGRNTFLGSEFLSAMKTLAENSNSFAETIETQKMVAEAFQRQLSWLGKKTKAILAITIFTTAVISSPISFLLGSYFSASAKNNSFPFAVDGGVDRDHRRYYSLRSDRLSEVTREKQKVTLYLED